MTTLAQSKRWQILRATTLHDAFRKAELRMQAEGLSLQKILLQLRALLAGTVVAGKLIKISRGSLKANWYRWKSGGKTAESLLLAYTCGQSGQSSRLPAELIKEFHRRATLPGMANITVVYKSLVNDWKAGKEIPGLGCNVTSGSSVTVGCNVTLPPSAEDAPAASRDFPFSLSAFYKHQPTKQERALGNKGFAALKQASPYVSLNYSKLRKCELFVLDDVRLDILVIDQSTGEPIELKAYIMMEAGSRFIVGYVLKPAAAIKQEDVDELIAYTLETTGIGRDYTTHIKLERGTVAMSMAAQQFLESATNGRIQIHRTGMDGGVRWIGSHSDKRSGHWMGKAVIESFMRKLHLSLMTLPGQRGNKHENQPANLGLEAIGAAPTKGSLLEEAQQLAALQLTLDNQKSEIINHKSRVRLSLPMLYLYQFERVFKAAIDKHNHETGCDYQGHGSFYEAETSPGTWTPTSL